MKLSDRVEDLPNIGKKTAERLRKLGIEKPKDLLTFYPRNYEDRSRVCTIFEAPLADGKVCVRGMLRGEPVTARINGGRTMVKATVCDGSADMEVIFFNQPYVKSALKRDREYVFFGKAEAGYGKRSMVNPLFEESSAHRKTGALTAIYRGTQGLSPGVVSGAVSEVLAAASGEYEETLPYEIIDKYRLCTPEEAFTLIHKPQSWDDVKKARRRLIFEELFMFCLTTRYVGRREKTRGVKLSPVDMEEFYRLLPYKPTGAQKRAVLDGVSDMCSGERMNRLLQGDVGSGKTLVAAALSFLAVKNGGQAVIMAPTELLAHQHFETLCGVFEKAGIKCELLTSDMPAAAKKAAKERIKNGEARIICGTHALIQQDTAFKEPYLFVVDEQHRFGVRQRAALSEKAGSAHFMVMSATPIPRTLTLMLYGDLSLSVLDERPPGRKPVLTYVVPEEKRAGMFGMIRDTARSGGQTYVVCPLIDDGETQDDRKAVSTVSEKMKKMLPELRIGLMHSRLKAAEKEEIMDRFSKGELDVLVSTTVVEVGTNVPNARIMVVENAGSFGLSQLHQLRGRVGRSTEQAYCFLMSEDKNGGSERLSVMCKTDDGFKIAEEDLRIRGPGDFLGDRQHGAPEFAIADLASDMRVLACAKEEAERLFERDSDLSRHPQLLARVKKLISYADGTMN